MKDEKDPFPFHLLPEESRQKIFNLLDLKDQMRLVQVNRDLSTLKSGEHRLMVHFPKKYAEIMSELKSGKRKSIDWHAELSSLNKKAYPSLAMQELFVAIKDKNLDKLNKIISEGKTKIDDIFVDTESVEYQPAIGCMHMNDFQEGLNAVYEGMCVKEYSENPQNLLQYALMTSQNLDVVRAICEPNDEEAKIPDINYFDGYYEETPLVLACTAGSYEVAKYFIEDLDADVNLGSPLVCSCLRGNADLVSLLISHGADINKSLPYAEATPLIAAMANGNIKIIDILIKNGVSVGDLEKEGMVKILEEKMANTDKATSQYKKASELLCNAIKRPSNDNREALLDANIQTELTKEPLSLFYKVYTHAENQSNLKSTISPPK
jgi:hypothetical protein